MAGELERNHLARAFAHPTSLRLPRRHARMFGSKVFPGMKAAADGVALIGKKQKIPDVLVCDACQCEGIRRVPLVFAIGDDERIHLALAVKAAQPAGCGLVMREEMELVTHVRRLLFLMHNAIGICASKAGGQGLVIKNKGGFLETSFE